MMLKDPLFAHDIKRETLLIDSFCASFIPL